jgi:hypothetical protein
MKKCFKTKIKNATARVLQIKAREAIEARFLKITARVLSQARNLCFGWSVAVYTTYTAEARGKCS